MDIQQNFDLWKNGVKNQKDLAKLQSMTEEEKRLAFFKDIEFGTAGMRGVLGLGSNYMNEYTVGRVTKAVCLYIKSIGRTSLAVSYDSRKMSPEFAKLVAEICAQNGIYVYISKEMMPTPFLSYMVRFYGCGMGVMITASHNPKEYNGYKVYDENGCQLLEEPSKQIMKFAEVIDQFSIEKMDFKQAVKKGFVKFVDADCMSGYETCVIGQSKEKIENIKVLYTALNGAGINTIPSVLKKRGAKLYFDKVQCKRDENFTTCEYPNPEKEEVYAHSEPLARKHNVDLIVASDPDADRIGVGVLHNGNYVYLTGNDIGVLFTDYLLSTRNKKGGYIVRSIVTTPLTDMIAAKYGIKTVPILTGFKYVGEFIKNLEDKGKEDDFVLGYEESHGYLAGTYVRDKDATVASMLAVELASHLKKQGKTLVDKLNELFDQFGYFEQEIYSFRFDGAVGLEKKNKILKRLRENAPKKFGDLSVKNVLDYKDGVNGLPKSDVLEFELSDNARVIIRPSGTEPLIKVYLTLAETKEKNEINKLKVKDSLKEIFE